MTVFFDASALLALHIDGGMHAVVVEELRTDTSWCASALALTEALAAATRLTDEPVLQDAIEESVRRTWDFLHVVPVDQRCLDDATALMSQQPVGTSAALHLAAASRLPQPVRFVTFDASQIPVALSLGFDVVSI